MKERRWDHINIRRTREGKALELPVRDTRNWAAALKASAETSDALQRRTQIWDLSALLANRLACALYIAHYFEAVQLEPPRNTACFNGARS